MQPRFPDIDESFDPEALMNLAPQPMGVELQQPVQEEENEPQPEATVQEAPAAPKVHSRLGQFLHDSRLSLFTGIVLLVAALYMVVITVSYYANISHDQSALLSGEITPDQIWNQGGPVGAWFSHFLLYDWLGLGSFIMIFYVVMLGLSLVKVVKSDFWVLTFRCLLVAIAISIVGGLATYEFASPIYWGGRHGHYLNQRLIELTGIWGALGVTVIMAAAVVLLFLSRLKHWTLRLVAWCRKLSEKRAAIRAAKAEMRRQRIEREEELRRQQEAERQRKAEEEEMEQPAAETTETPSSAPQPDPRSIAEPDKEEAQAEASELEPVEPAVELKPLFGGTDPLPSSQPSDGPTLVVETPIIEQAEPTTQSVDMEMPQDPMLPSLDLGANYDPRADLSNYRFPTVELLHEREYSTNNVDATEMEENKQRITKTLGDYGIPISHIHATVGPTVTLYEIIPAEGVRIAKIKRLEDDIALSLAALGIRIIAPIPGKGTIGIEVPNKEPQTVSIRSILGSKKFQDSHMDLPMAMGSTISNEVFMADLCKMPHLLVAGATGMGKSVGLNAIIASLLYKKHPAELKFVLIDPKMVEFSLYARLENHYLAKLPGEEDAIITDPSKVVATLNSLCVEMDNRYSLLKDAACRNVKEYNEKFVRRILNPEKGHRFMPYIVVVVDEFADLIMTAGKEVEMPIARIAQKARAVGIHMILATQRPSTNVITGIIKANFPGRVAFRVFQMVDSRTILDRPGANQLIGRGDMLFSNNGKIDRVQCAFIDTDEVEALCAFISDQPGYGGAYELPEFVAESDAPGAIAHGGMERDPLFDEAARLVVSTDTASTSSLQRRYSIGYNRAGKIMDQMEAAGIVGPSQGGKPRQVLADPMTLERILGNN